MKTYDSSIIHNTIPMVPDDKPIQQNPRKIHTNLENQIKSGLNKLKVKINFPFRHFTWVSNMVPINRKKNGVIHICIDFRNLNKSCMKDNFPLPPMEQIVQSVVGSELMTLLNGFSRYNQILLQPNYRLKTTFRTKFGTYAFKKMHF